MALSSPVWAALAAVMPGPALNALPRETLKREPPPEGDNLSGAVEEFGSFLLSRAKMRSIIGEEELNCRVRNGIGCTLYSVAAKRRGRRASRAVPALFRGLAPPELPSNIIDREWKDISGTSLTGY